MFQSTHPENDELFKIYAPLATYKGLISIPHAGEVIPKDFLPYLSGDEHAYFQDIDFKTNELVDIEALRLEGIAVLVANIQRICVDLNRSPELTVLNWKQNSMGKTLVSQNPAPEESEHLRMRYYNPYYTTLKSLIQELEHHLSGKVPVVDLHSMPSKPTAYHMKQNPKQPMSRPDFCISDQHGKTCAPEFINHVCDELKNESFNVKINDPYIGGYLTEYINNFRTNNIQIEINRGIYMDEEKRILVKEKVDHLKPKLTNALISLFQKFH